MNSKTDDPEAYYPIAFIIAFLDYLLSEIESRFNKDSFDVIKGFSIIPLTNDNASE